jgi:hypothetical protein
MSEDKKETPTWKETKDTAPKGGVYDSLLQSLNQAVSQFEATLKRDMEELKRAELEVARVKAQKESRRDG